MRKAIFKGAFIFTFLICVFHVTAQITISGPTCVLPDVAYSYKIVSAWAVKTTMQVCINNGTISGNDSALQNCTPKDGAPLGAVTIIWKGSGKGSLTLNSSAGTATLEVNITRSLQPGNIVQRSKRQIIGYDSIPATIYCAIDTGGSCSPQYTSQWQQSEDIANWTNLNGATSQNLSLTTPLKQSLFFRRKITEITSGTIAYSDVAAVYVAPVAQQIEDSLRAAKADSASTGFAFPSKMYKKTIFNNNVHFFGESVAFVVSYAIKNNLVI